MLYFGLCRLGLGGLTLEAGLLMTRVCFSFGRGAGGREALVAAVLLGHLLAQGLELLCFGSEAAGLYARGLLGNEVAHEGDFLMQKQDYVRPMFEM